MYLCDGCSTRAKIVFMATECNRGTRVEFKTVHVGPVRSDNDERLTLQC